MTGLFVDFKLFQALGSNVAASTSHVLTLLRVADANFRVRTLMIILFENDSVLHACMHDR